MMKNKVEIELEEADQKLKTFQEKQLQADQQTLKKFAEAFAKLRAEYPSVEVCGIFNGDVEAIIKRGLLKSRVYLTK